MRLALWARSAILSEFHQAKTLVPAAIAKAITIPVAPPIIQPTPTNSAVSAAISIPVRSRFILASCLPLQVLRSI